MMPEGCPVRRMSSTTSSSSDDEPATVTTNASSASLGSTTMRDEYLARRASATSYDRAATPLATFNVAVATATSSTDVVVAAGRKRRVHDVSSESDASGSEHFDVASNPSPPPPSSSSHHQRRRFDNEALACDRAVAISAVDDGSPPPAAAAAAAAGALVPRPQDVLFGRGQPLRDHPGNVRMREIVAEYLDSYRSARKPEKTRIIVRVTESVRSNGARFLAHHEDESDGDDVKWRPATRDEIRKKISHSLRDGNRKEDLDHRLDDEIIDLFRDEIRKNLFDGSRRKDLDEEIVDLFANETPSSSETNNAGENHCNRDGSAVVVDQCPSSSEYVATTTIASRNDDSPVKYQTDLAADTTTLATATRIDDDLSSSETDRVSDVDLSSSETQRVSDVDLSSSETHRISDDGDLSLSETHRVSDDEHEDEKDDSPPAASRPSNDDEKDEPPPPTNVSHPSNDYGGGDDDNNNNNALLIPADNALLIPSTVPHAEPVVVPNDNGDEEEQHKARVVAKRQRNIIRWLCVSLLVSSTAATILAALLIRSVPASLKISSTSTSVVSPPTTVPSRGHEESSSPSSVSSTFVSSSSGSPSSSYGGSQLPSFEWATAAVGTDATFVAAEIEVVGDLLVAVGHSSTLRSTTNDTTDYYDYDDIGNEGRVGIRGPYDRHVAVDRSTVTAAAGDKDMTVVSVDARTGEPRGIASVPGAGSRSCRAMAVGGGKDSSSFAVVAVGEIEAGDARTFHGAERCDPVVGYGGSKVECRLDDDTTVLSAGTLRRTAWVTSLRHRRRRDDDDGDQGYELTVKWAVLPWIRSFGPFKRADNGENAIDESDEVRFVQHLLSDVAVADADGDVFVLGHRVAMSSSDPSSRVRFGVVARLRGEDGSTVWERSFPDPRQRLLRLSYDVDGALYVLAETRHHRNIWQKASQLELVEHDGDAGFGVTTEDCLGLNLHTDHQDKREGCTFLARLSTADGTVEWVRHWRSLHDADDDDGSPARGRVRVAHPEDGPYVYVASAPAPGTLDRGSGYGGCLFVDDSNATIFVPEFDDRFANRVATPELCALLGMGDHVSRDSPSALPAREASDTEARCDEDPSDSLHKRRASSSTCLVKIHKHHGRPVWGSSVPRRVNDLATLPDGASLVGSSAVVLEDPFELAAPFGRMSGYESIWHAEVDAETGRGRYVQPIVADRSWMSGSSVTRSPDGKDVYLSVATASAMTFWGSGPPAGLVVDLRNDDDVKCACDYKDVPCKGDPRFLVTKLGPPVKPHCVLSGDFDAAEPPRTAPGTCLIDRVCYNTGDSAAYLGQPCLFCDPRRSTTEWTFASSYSDKGYDFCLVDGVCWYGGEHKPMRVGDRPWGVVNSACLCCDPTVDELHWVVDPAYYRRRMLETEEPNDSPNNAVDEECEMSEMVTNAGESLSSFDDYYRYEDEEGTLRRGGGGTKVGFLSTLFVFVSGALFSYAVILVVLKVVSARKRRRRRLRERQTVTDAESMEITATIPMTDRWYSLNYDLSVLGPVTAAEAVYVD